MWDQLTAEERAWQARCRAFAAEVIAPRAAAHDRANGFAADVHEAAHAAGLMNVCLPEALGGRGAGHRFLAVGGEELAAACAPIAFSLGFNHGALRPIVAFGTDAQRRRFVRDLLAERGYASICMTEAASSGSSLARIRSRAVRRGDRWLLTAAKQMIGNGTVAGVFVVLASAIVDGHDRGPTFFVVPRGPGVRVGANPEKIGFRALPTPPVDFDGVEVPDDQRVGEIGGAEAVLVDSLDFMRFGGGCVLLGLVTGALREVMPWLEAREVGDGGTLVERSHVQLLLGDLFGELRALRALLWQTAALLDAGRRCSVETAIVKLRASRLAERATSEIAQLYGWRGLDAAYGAEKRMRDARVTTVYEGTTEVQRLNLFAELRRALRGGGDL
jgi:alkylation response protein AidB-like acyl-CoA dehydrogenase